jgi:hypothetical protein
MRKAMYEAAKRRALARKPFLKTDGRYRSSEESHNRDGLRISQLRQRQWSIAENVPAAISEETASISGASGRSCTTLADFARTAS